jgi:hypothetical protein
MDPRLLACMIVHMARRKPPTWRTVTCAFAALLVLLVISWYAWYSYACHALDSAIAHLHASGIGTSPATSVTPTTVPAAQNAVDLLQRAYAARRMTRADEEFLFHASSGYPWMLPLTQADAARSAELYQRNAETLDLLHRAAEAPAVAWPPYDPTRPGAPSRLAGQQRSLVVLIQAMVFCLHQDGDDRAALGLLRDQLAASDALIRYAMPVPFISGCGAQGTALDGLCQVTSTLRVGEGPGDANAEGVQRLIQKLLDQSAYARCAERAFASNVDATAQQAASRPWLVRPVALLEARRFVLLLPTAAGSFSGRAWPFSTRPWSASPGGPRALTVSRPEHLEEALRDQVAWGGTLFTLRRRVAATALALRLYDAHHGVLPPGLSDLVPAYLPAVTEDPFATAGTALQYDRIRRIIYSVGRNGADDGGSATVIPGQLNMHDADSVYQYGTPSSPPTP